VQRKGGAKGYKVKLPGNPGRGEQISGRRLGEYDVVGKRKTKDVAWWNRKVVGGEKGEEHKTRSIPNNKGSLRSTHSAFTRPYWG